MSNFLVPFRKVITLTLILSLACWVQSFAVTYYSKTNGGFWNDPLTWSTVTYGNATNTGTFPKKGDVVFVGDGYTVYMNMNAVSASVTVGQGTSGNIEFSPFLSFNMTIAGSLTINNGGRFGYLGNASRTHSLFISGSIVNNGILDLYSDPNDFVNLTFNSKINSIISGSGIFDLNRVTLFKGTATSYYLDVQTNAFENAIRQLVVSYGTYIHNNLGTYLVNPTLTNFTIAKDAIIKVPIGIMHFSPTSNYTFLQGKIIVNGGIVRVGSTAGLQGLRYEQNGLTIPSLNISSGSMEVYGGITYSSSTPSSPFSVDLSGGSLLLNSGTTGTSYEVFNVNDVIGSSFLMTTGTMTLQKPTLGGSARADFNICGTNGTVNASVGIVSFGNASTANGSIFNFVPYPGVIQPNFIVTGSPAAAITLSTSNNSTADFELNSLLIDVNKTFDIRSIAGTTGDSKNMTLVDNFDGINTLNNNGTFIPRTSNVILQGFEGIWLSGSTLTTFYNLTINNSFGVSLASSINVSNSLTLTNGVLYSSSANMITCIAGASSTIGSSASYIDGPFAQVIASTLTKTFNIPVGKSGAYRPMILVVRHTNSTSIAYTSEAWNSSARTFGYTLPPTLSYVSDVRYYTINRTAIANLASSRITLSYGPDDVVTDNTNLRVARYSGAGSWIDNGGIGTANVSGSITSNVFSSFNTYFTLGNTINGTNPLPVTLVAFNAKKSSQKVNLDWQTASEKNADYFNVERSIDGNDFKLIGKISASGNSTSLKSYSLIDENPIFGNNYYRLKQIDFDGSFIYSDIKTVYLGKTSLLSMYPNPAVNKSFTIKIPEQVQGDYSVQLIDNAGRIIYQQSGNPAEEKEFYIHSLNLLHEGAYIAKIIDNDGQQWQDRLVVINE